MFYSLNNALVGENYYTFRLTIIFYEFFYIYLKLLFAVNL
ncbi:hypothetical [Yersinia pestis KIM10+]|uniref:Uncharacterized protein n=1 Tax=Yersinia pestis TaxID=632 RepID=Q8CLM5_YERPE|nr:hypothetical [Yersinia pestis KIM10+]EIQ86143.1 putative membrane protein [Yersinia pestis PY-03]